MKLRWLHLSWQTRLQLWGCRKLWTFISIEMTSSLSVRSEEQQKYLSIEFSFDQMPAVNVHLCLVFTTWFDSFYLWHHLLFAAEMTSSVWAGLSADCHSDTTWNFCDITFNATLSQNRRTSAPRQGALRQILQIWHKRPVGLKWTD